MPGLNAPRKGLNIFSKRVLNWELMAFSNSLEMNGRMLISLYFCLSKGSFFLYTGITCASLNLLGKAEVATEWFINFASGSEIVLLQDFIIFAGMASTPVAFLDLDIDMKVSVLSEVTGLKSKAVVAGLWSVIFWMLGWFNMSFGIGTDDMSWAAFTKELVQGTRNRDLV